MLNEDEQKLRRVKQKLIMLDLLYEFNQLQFALSSYIIINKLKSKQSNTFSIYDAIEIVTPLFHKCLKESKNYLNLEELNILFTFAATCLFEVIREDSL